ncbi:Coenzyme PQQ synthesis protein E [uncultured archaeon]|nr:Coenzyme PQQ synthesis protein E [uncultured archaeon]
MRKINYTPAKSMLVGELPRGCRLCITGEKLVLFVSGLCPRDCFYCTLSEKRKNTDKSWANEQLIESDNDLLKEARLCQSRGAGITGGEPLLPANIGKTLHYIELLKKTFGKEFHIHLYTSGIGMNESVLQQLQTAGLDEIRFHLDIDNEKNWNIMPYGKLSQTSWEILLPALKHKFDVGVEIPCIPGTLKKLERLAQFLDSQNVKFLNLNELELSEIQYDEMQKRGFELAEGGTRQVKGSRELAQKILLFSSKNCKNLSVHFCPSMLKDVYQYTNRIKRRAESIKKPFEKVTKEGLLQKGAIFAKIKELDFLPKNELFFRHELDRVETSVKNAELAAKHGFSAAKILELPTADGFDIELEPIESRSRKQPKSR